MESESARVGEGEGEGEGEEGDGGETERRSKGETRSCGKRISPEGWAKGVLTPMFELITSYVSASWCMVKKECVRATNSEVERAKGIRPSS